MANYKKQNNKEVREFLKSIDSDFYLDLHKYVHFADKIFDTDDLTITQILQICESYILMVSSATHIVNELDVCKAVSLVIQRVGGCGNKILSNKAIRIVRNMDCYLFTKTSLGDRVEELTNQKAETSSASLQINSTIEIGVNAKPRRPKSVFV